MNLKPATPESEFVKRKSPKTEKKNAVSLFRENNRENW